MFARVFSKMMFFDFKIWKHKRVWRMRLRSALWFVMPFACISPPLPKGPENVEDRLATFCWNVSNSLRTGLWVSYKSCWKVPQRTWARILGRTVSWSRMFVAWIRGHCLLPAEFALHCFRFDSYRWSFIYKRACCKSSNCCVKNISIKRRHIL